VADRECAVVSQADPSRPALAISAVLRRLLRRARQHLFAPLIEALAGSFRGERGVGVDGRADSQHQLPGIGFLRVLADLGAMVEVIVDRLVKRRLQPFHVVRVKADSVAYAEYPAKKDFIVGVVFDASVVALLGHHIFTPILSRNSRAILT